MKRIRSIGLVALPLVLIIAISVATMLLTSNSSIRGISMSVLSSFVSSLVVYCLDKYKDRTADLEEFYVKALEFNNKALHLPRASEGSIDKRHIVRSYMALVESSEGIELLYGRLWFVSKGSRELVYDVYRIIVDSISELKANFLVYDMTTDNVDVYFKRIVMEQDNFFRNGESIGNILKAKLEKIEPICGVLSNN